MKSAVGMAVGAVVVLLAGHGSAAAAEEGQFELESARIVYELTGMQQGKQVVSFEDHGKRMRQEVDATMSMMGITMPLKTISITDGDTMYTLDPDKRTATKIDMSGVDRKRMQAFSEEMLKQMGLKKTGASKTVAGKTCEVYEAEGTISPGQAGGAGMAGGPGGPGGAGKPAPGIGLGTKNCLWKSMPLEIQMDMMGMQMNIRATSIETGIDIPDADLKVPEGYQIADQVDMKAMMENLKGLQVRPGREGAPAFKLPEGFPGTVPPPQGSAD